LLTNDIEAPGDGAFVYGALLTPKGMIVVDGWAARRGATVRFTITVEGHEAALALLKRSVPPRLARIVDRSREVTVLRLAGPRAIACVQQARLGVSLPLPARAIWQDDLEIARAPDGSPAPFSLQITVPLEATSQVVDRLVSAGALRAESGALELNRILAGWPRIGAEVDAKTIPQEVRFDEIGGVSYTKGCYTGQETVSRLHFRGHANRELRGLRFDAEPQAVDPMVVTQDSRDVGRATSVAVLPWPEREWIGLAVVRREIQPGAVVRAGNVDARIESLPFSTATEFGIDA
jgi:folate-binding protein YgfZ